MWRAGREVGPFPFSIELNFRKMAPCAVQDGSTRPERAEAPSPGHRPGLLWTQTCRPVRAKALKNQAKFIKLLPLQGALLATIIPRAMPWARSFCPFRACCFWNFWAFSPYLNHMRKFRLFLKKGIKKDWILLRRFSLTKKWYHQESNRGHKDFQSFALPTELWHQLLQIAIYHLRVQR